MPAVVGTARHSDPRAGPPVSRAATCTFGDQGPAVASSQQRRLGRAGWIWLSGAPRCCGLLLKAHGPRISGPLPGATRISSADDCAALLAAWTNKGWRRGGGLTDRLEWLAGANSTRGMSGQRRKHMPFRRCRQEGVRGRRRVSSVPALLRLRVAARGRVTFRLGWRSLGRGTSARLGQIRAPAREVRAVLLQALHCSKQYPTARDLAHEGNFEAFPWRARRLPHPAIVGQVCGIENLRMGSCAPCCGFFKCRPG